MIKTLKVKKVNNSYKALFSKDENEILEKLCGNSLGCSFAVDENKPCGTTSQCNSCLIRNCLTTIFNKSEQTENAYITKTFYINEKPIIKHFRIKARQIIYNNEDMAIVAIDDVTELEEQKEQIKDMANKDFLTNLYNRRYVYEISGLLYENAKRENLKLAVIMIDIDHFKKINDTYGHKAGDFILISIAEIFRNNIRKSDTASRIGGEEFCLLLNVKKTTEAYTIMEKIRKTVETNSFIFENKTIPVTISSGITTELENSFDDMIKRADMMLYKAKENGRNQTQIFKP